MADQATDNFEQQFTLSLMENEEQTLGEIAAALDRIEHFVQIEADSSLALRCIAGWRRHAGFVNMAAPQPKRARFPHGVPRCHDRPLAPASMLRCTLPQVVRRVRFLMPLALPGEDRTLHIFAGDGTGGKRR